MDNHLGLNRGLCFRKKILKHSLDLDWVALETCDSNNGEALHRSATGFVEETAIRRVGILVSRVGISDLVTEFGSVLTVDVGNGRCLAAVALASGIVFSNPASAILVFKPWLQGKFCVFPITQ